MGNPAYKENNAKTFDKPAGFRDYTQEETIERARIINTVKNIFELYGFLPTEQPALEKLSVLTAKSGDEIKNEIFLIRNEEAGLRFDLTIGFARYVATNRDLVKPIKRYIIEKAWRNEEPQKGRYREFLQADIDIIGVKEQTAELEIINCLIQCLNAINIKDIKLEINDREFLESYANYKGLNKKQDIYRILDKKDKLSYQEWIKALEQTGEFEKIKDLIKDKENTEETLKFISFYNDNSAKKLEFLLNNLRSLNAKSNVIKEIKINPYLIRGLDYYTGIIFEFKKDNLTIAAGGRYDNLLSIYGQADYAVGGSIGIDRIWALKKEEQKDAKIKKEKNIVYIINFEDTLVKSYEIAAKLRDNGIKTDINLGKRALTKQLEYANAQGFKYVIFAGKKELDENKLKIKDMETGKEEIKTIEEIIRLLKSQNI